MPRRAAETRYLVHNVVIVVLNEADLTLQPCFLDLKQLLRVAHHVGISCNPVEVGKPSAYNVDGIPVCLLRFFGPLGSLPHPHGSLQGLPLGKILDGDDL